MNKYSITISTVLLMLLLTGCDISITAGNRSGTADNDNVEEPLSNNTKKYENALKVSNEIMDNIISNNFTNIHNNYVHKDMKSTLTEDILKSTYAQAYELLGPIKGYKKMQWGFVPAEENGTDILFSYKLVEHSKDTVNYAFVFYDDGNYEKIIGISVKSFDGIRKPNEF